MRASIEFEQPSLKVNGSSEGSVVADVVFRAWYKGENGKDGKDGKDGANGIGVPTGGAQGQILAKRGHTDFDCQWIDPPKGGGLIEITYNELKTLRDSSSLIVGTEYRITDYECTTSETNTQSAGHAFDIVVKAIGENVLSEDARALPHSGDTYFNGMIMGENLYDGSGQDYARSQTNFTSWQLKYTIDNDFTQQSWAQPAAFSIGNSYQEGDQTYSNISDTLYEVEHRGTAEYNGTTYHKWNHNPSQQTYLTLSRNPQIGDAIYDEMGIMYEGDDYQVWQWVLETYPSGKGVIYYMKDDRGNAAYYDFKNILFETYNHNLLISAQYTFSPKKDRQQYVDASIADIQYQTVTNNTILGGSNTNYNWNRFEAQSLSKVTMYAPCTNNTINLREATTTCTVEIESATNNTITSGNRLNFQSGNINNCTFNQVEEISSTLYSIINTTIHKGVRNINLDEYLASWNMSRNYCIDIYKSSAGEIIVTDHSENNSEIDTYTKAEIDAIIGNIETLLEEV